MFSFVVCRFGQGPRFRTSGPRLREVFGTREITTMASGCTCCVYTERPSVVHTVAGVYFRSMRCERGRVRGRRCVSVGARARARARVRGRAVARVRGPAGPRVRGLAGPRVRGSAGALARAYSGCVLQAQGVSISARESLLACGSQCWCVGVPLDMWEPLLTSPILAENDT